MKRNRLLILSLLGVVALSATSVSFSFAWYASATRLRIEPVRIEADPNRSLMLATSEDGEYKTALSPEDLPAMGFLIPVSTCFAATWRGISDMPAFYDLSYVASVPTPSLHPASKSGYWSQELWLRADDDVLAAIDMTGVKITADHEKNAEYAKELVTIDPDFTEEEHLARLDKAKDCGRISVLIDEDYYILDPNQNEEGPVYYAGPLDNGVKRYYDTYFDSDNGEYEVCYGELLEGKTRKDLTYAPVGESDIPAEGEYTAFTAKHKAGTYMLDVEKNKEIFATEPRLGLEDFLPDPKEDPVYTFRLQRYVPKRVVVSFYLEGWDLDSVNAAMGAACDFQLRFKILRER